MVPDCRSPMLVFLQHHVIKKELAMAACNIHHSNTGSHSDQPGTRYFPALATSHGQFTYLWPLFVLGTILAQYHFEQSQINMKWAWYVVAYAFFLYFFNQPGTPTERLWN